MKKAHTDTVSSFCKLNAFFIPVNDPSHTP